jgi:hypothetical protein
MREDKRYALLGLALLAMLLLGTGTVDARPAGAKRLRQQIVELKGRLARLESQVQFQGRRLETMPPIVSASGLCADPCAADSDGDGQGDCVDPCPCDPANLDDDGDGIPDCLDPCPGDGTNACIDPCRMDSDGDGTPDCEDVCPWDPSLSRDDDADGIPDCTDPCPGDSRNACTGPCMLDSDGDGMLDCMDPCPFGGGPDTSCGETHGGMGMMGR